MLSAFFGQSDLRSGSRGVESEPVGSRREHVSDQERHQVLESGRHFPYVPRPHGLSLGLLDTRTSRLERITDLGKFSRDVRGRFDLLGRHAGEALAQVAMRKAVAPADEKVDLVHQLVVDPALQFSSQPPRLWPCL